MYILRVLYPGPRLGAEDHVDKGGDVLSRVPELLKSHPECERIDICLGASVMFSVDCKGNRLPTTP